MIKNTQNFDQEKLIVTMFGAVELVYGVKFSSRKKFIKFLRELDKKQPMGLEEEIDDYLEAPDDANPLHDSVNTILKEQLLLTAGDNHCVCWTPPCCSDNTDQVFVIGLSVKSIPRINKRCTNCEEYTLCDECLSRTEDGPYDVIKLADEFVKVKTKSDKVKDIQVPKFPAVLDETFKDLGLKYDFYLTLDDCLSCT